MNDQLELHIKPRGEETRLKQQPPDTTKIPNAEPRGQLPKRAKTVKGFTVEPFVQPLGNGGRVMVLDRVQVGVVLEDPFFDKGTYPIPMMFEGLNEWIAAEPEEVSFEHARLGIQQPGELMFRCGARYLLQRYLILLDAARKDIEDETKRVEKLLIEMKRTKKGKRNG